MWPILRPGARFELAVEMELGFGMCAGGGPVGFARLPEIAQEIGHGGGAEHVRGAEREAADGAELLFELAGDAGIDGEVAGVVRARGEFVDRAACRSGSGRIPRRGRRRRRAARARVR